MTLGLGRLPGTLVVACVVFAMSWVAADAAQKERSVPEPVAAESHEEETFGAEPNPTGDPIGGGEGYGRIVPRPEKVVASAQELLAALAGAEAGDVIYIDDDARINLTGHQRIVIPGGVTLASGRGRDGSEGAWVYTNTLETLPLFATGGTGVRVTGLCLMGPDPEMRDYQMHRLLTKKWRKAYYTVPTSKGVQSSHEGLEVDNCELWGWSSSAVCLDEGSKAHVHHNYIHHCRRAGLGYGVALDKAEALVEANLFDWCRHAIAGGGSPGTSYEARYNIHLENATSHVFDMHGGGDRGDGTNIAGDWIKIHHNTIRQAREGNPAIHIRGVPTKGAEVHHNWFFHEDIDAAVMQMHGKADRNVKVYRNWLGPDAKLAE